MSSKTDRVTNVSKSLTNVSNFVVPADEIGPKHGLRMCLVFHFSTKYFVTTKNNRNGSDDITYYNPFNCDSKNKYIKSLVSKDCSISFF